MSVIDSPNVVTTGSMKNNTMRMVAGSRKTTGAAYRSEGEGRVVQLAAPFVEEPVVHQARGGPQDRQVGAAHGVLRVEVRHRGVREQSQRQILVLRRR